jgi:phosphoribosyl 1,2-cyclic phosphodiesterase
MGVGGNTSCLEVRVGEHLIILDSGTGIRSLGRSLLQRDVRKATLLLSHTHWDHINGFPFFQPAFDPKRAFRILAGHLGPETGGIRQALSGQMTQPMFPVPLETMRATLDFEDFQAGDRFTLDGGIVVRTAPLQHPNGATGYRIEHGGRSFCYVTDTEHTPGKPDERILALIEGCDLFVYDSTYTDEEFPAKVSWGHSTWQEGVRLARAANVRRYGIFHHDPDHEDPFMDQVEKDAQQEFSSAFVTREGVSIELK